MGEELLWASSMPCELNGDDEVPIARYGSSHQGRLKSIYRHGLQDPLWRHDAGYLRRAFQLFAAGVVLAAVRGVLPEPRLPARSYRSARYFDLLRNYRRHGWIVSYLFGVSPALCRSFLQGRSDAGLERAGRRIR